jgi:hypothetical protein
LGSKLEDVPNEDRLNELHDIAALHGQMVRHLFSSHLFVAKGKLHDFVHGKVSALNRFVYQVASEDLTVLILGLLMHEVVGVDVCFRHL